MQWPSSNRIARFNASADFGRFSRTRSDRLVRHVDMGQVNRLKPYQYKHNDRTYTDYKSTEATPSFRKFPLMSDRRKASSETGMYCGKSRSGLTHRKP